MTVIVIAIIFSAYFVQAAFGFGAGLIALPILSLFMDAKDAILFVALFSLLCGFLTIKLYRDIVWSELCKLAPGLVIGVVLGLWLFSSFDRRILGILMALYILAYVVNDSLQGKLSITLGKKIPAWVQATLCGVAGGVIQGVMGTGGPMLVTYLKQHTPSNTTFRSTVMCVFFLANIIRLIFIATALSLPAGMAELAAYAMPFFILALYLGCHMPSKMSQPVFNLAINFLLTVTAITLLVQNMRLISL